MEDSLHSSSSPDATIQANPSTKVTPDSSSPVLVEDEPAPLWLSKAAYFFRLGITIFLAITCFFLWSCSATGGMTWRDATQVFSREQVGALLIENSTLTQPNDEQIDRVRAVAIEDVVVLNFNQLELCGTGGCLYAIYDKSGSNAFLKTYLQPNLPPNIPLIAAAGQSLNNHPCLQIHQVESETAVKQFLLCNTGGHYSVTNQIERVLKDKD
ncbi:hypothetical protein H6F87_26245 [Cyanobacteria bacterium FACHB-502]|nr:hypothetical protein [Cyanobacteria bacterium FACHB-502]